MNARVVRVQSDAEEIFGGKWTFTVERCTDAGSPHVLDVPSDIRVALSEWLKEAE